MGDVEAGIVEQLTCNLPGLNKRLTQSSKSIPATGHRRENFGKGLENICRTLERIATTYPDVVIVYPVYFNPNV